MYNYINSYVYIYELLTLVYIIIVDHVEKSFDFVRKIIYFTDGAA